MLATGGRQEEPSPSTLAYLIIPDFSLFLSLPLTLFLRTRRPPAKRQLVVPARQSRDRSECQWVTAGKLAALRILNDQNTHPGARERPRAIVSVAANNSSEP